MRTIRLSLDASRLNPQQCTRARSQEDERVCVRFRFLVGIIDRATSEVPITERSLDSGRARRCCMYRTGQAEGVLGSADGD